MCAEIAVENYVNDLTIKMYHELYNDSQDTRSRFSTCESECWVVNTFCKNATLAKEVDPVIKLLQKYPNCTQEDVSFKPCQCD